MAGWSPSEQRAGSSRELRDKTSANGTSPGFIDNSQGSGLTVVVDVLASNDRCLLRDNLLLTLDTLVTELSTLLLKTSSDGGVVAVVDVTLLNTRHTVRMLLGKHFAVLHGLNGGVVVVLVDLLVDSHLGLLNAGLVDGLLHDGRCNLFVDGGVIVTGLVPRVVGTRSVTLAQWRTRLSHI